MIKDLISVIVPAHNARATLKNTCDSILANDYENIEVLIIENNSRDNTLQIAKEIEQRDCRVRTFTTSQIGTSNARNIGLLNSRAEYITFVDADDVVSENYFMALMETMKRLDVDLVQCEMFKTIPQNKTYSEDVSKDKDQTLKWFLSNKLHGYCFGKLFVNSIIKNNGLKFNLEMEIGEDRNFVLEYLKVGFSVATISSELYHYVQNENSVLNKIFRKSRFDLVTESLIEYKYTLDNSARSNITIAKSNMIRENIRFLIMGSKNNVIDQNQYNQIRVMLQKNIMSVLKCDIKKSWKVYALCCCAFNLNVFKKCCLT